MANVIINASGAKHGGAREILRSFLHSLPEEGEDVYYVFCPVASEFSNLNKNIKNIECKTHGVFTFLFSVVFVYFYVLSLRADKVISFNNVNCFLAPNLVTYFHQEKAISGRGIRYLTIRLGIRLIFKGEFIVQSERMKKEFLKVFNVSPAHVHVKWPGVRKLPHINRQEALKNLRMSRLAGSIANFSLDRLAVLPVYDSRSSHKDFEFFFEIKKFLNSVGVVTVSLCPPGSNIADVDLGKVSTEELDWIYLCSDYMVIISLHETLCLPIFEFVQTNRLILARNASFIRDFKSLYPEWLVNLKILDPDFERRQLLDFIGSPTVTVKKNVVDRMCHGEWDI